MFNDMSRPKCKDQNWPYNPAGASPSWLTGIIRKRPEVGLVLHQLLLTIRRNGVATAEDAHNIAVSVPNVRGASMKLLGRCGCAKNPVPVRGTTRKSHGHWLHQWVISDPRLFHACTDRITEATAGIASEQTDTEGWLL